MIAHVNENGILFGRQFVEALGVQVHACIPHVERLVFQTVSYDFFPHFDSQSKKRVAVIDGFIQANALQERNAVEVRFKRFELRSRH